MAFLAIWVFKRVLPGFPKFGLTHVAVAAAAIAVLAYALTEMPGGYISAYGRAVLAWIAGTTVLSIYFTVLPHYNGHPYAYLESALAVGVVIGLTELIIAPKNSRQAHGVR